MIEFKGKCSNAYKKHMPTTIASGKPTRVADRMRIVLHWTTQSWNPWNKAEKFDDLVSNDLNIDTKDKKNQLYNKLI